MEVEDFIIKKLDNEEKCITVEIKVGHGKNDPLHIFYKIDNFLKIQTDKIFLGSKDSKICRFCKKDHSQTTFKKQAHVIPEFMGNKTFFSFFECDACNDLFSRYETSLASYGGILNTFSTIKGKKGYAKHKGTNENTETYIENGKIVMRIKAQSKKSIKSVKYDKKTGLMTFQTSKNSYIPLDAYKALVKIAFCMLNDKDILDYELMRKWLINEQAFDPESNKPLFNIFRRIGGKNFSHPFAILLKKREEFIKEPCPSHSFIIFYGIFGFQLFLPANNNDRWIWDTNKVILPIENHISYSIIDSDKAIKQTVDMMDFSSNQKLINPEDRFTIPFIPK